MVARPVWTDIAANLFRDYNTIGVPSSGIFLPPKADHRAYFLQMEEFFADLYDKSVNLLGTIGGTANAITAAATPAVDARAAGQFYILVPTSTNTAAGPTLAINGLAAGTLKDADGVDLPIGTLISGRALLIYDDGTNFRCPAIRDPLLYKVLDADATGSDVNTAQPWFPASGGITLPIGKFYFDGRLWTARTAGAVSHTTSLLFAGGATYTIDWMADVNIGDTAAVATATRVAAAVATATVIKAASTSTTENLLLSVRGRLDVTVAGTLIPQFQYSAAPGGAPTVKRGSEFRLFPRPGALASVGAWA